MNKKTVLIGLGVLAVAGIGYYMWKKKSETKSGACGCSGADGEDDNENDSSDASGQKMKDCCVKVDGNGKCIETKQVPTMTPCANPKRATMADL